MYRRLTYRWKKAKTEEVREEVKEEQVTLSHFRILLLIAPCGGDSLPPEYDKKMTTHSVGSEYVVPS
jgi:hypothetical protein